MKIIIASFLSNSAVRPSVFPEVETVANVNFDEKSDSWCLACWRDDKYIFCFVVLFYKFVGMKDSFTDMTVTWVNAINIENRKCRKAP